MYKFIFALILGCHLSIAATSKSKLSLKDLGQVDYKQLNIEKAPPKAKTIKKFEVSTSCQSSDGKEYQSNDLGYTECMDKRPTYQGQLQSEETRKIQVRY